MSKHLVLPHQFLLSSLDGCSASDIILDIVDVFAMIYLADITTRKPVDTKRTLSVEVPVHDVALWSQKEPIVSSMVSFVSGEKLKIQFTERGTACQGLAFDLSDQEGNVTLLSGGLDSFCGAYINVRDGHRSHYVSYKNNRFETSSQGKLIKYFSKFQAISHHQFSPLYKQKKQVLTQRTRCLLYISLAVLACGVLGINTIKLYENGILSLNPSFGRRDTTKSTHPKTLYLFNLLLAELGVQITIENPFFFKTKGQIVSELNGDFKANIPLTTTCGSNMQNRYRRGALHCGFCVPCILRKISMTAANAEAHDCRYQIGYEINPKDLVKGYIRTEYSSALNYFSSFKQYIDDKSIAHHIEVHSRYFKVDDYKLHLDDLFGQFSQEVEEFFERYELY